MADGPPDLDELDALYVYRTLDDLWSWKRVSVEGEITDATLHPWRNQGDCIRDAQRSNTDIDRYYLLLLHPQNAVFEMDGEPRQRLKAIAFYPEGSTPLDGVGG